MVEGVEDFHADLKFTFMIDTEAAKDAGIEVSHAGATELIASGVAEMGLIIAGGLNGVGESGWIKPQTATGAAGRTGMSTDLTIRSDEICIAGVARGVDGATGGGHGEGAAADMAHLTIQLPSSSEYGSHPVIEHCLTLAKRQVVNPPELYVVGAVIAGVATIQAEVGRVRELNALRSRTRSVVFKIDRMRPRINDTELRQPAGITAQLRLHAVVHRTLARCVPRDAAGVIADSAGSRGSTSAVLQINGLVGGEVAVSGDPS